MAQMPSACNTVLNAESIELLYKTAEIQMKSVSFLNQEVRTRFPMADRSLRSSYCTAVLHLTAIF